LSLNFETGMTLNESICPITTTQLHLFLS
jgi:hypothetical protein